MKCDESRVRIPLDWTTTADLEGIRLKTGKKHTIVLERPQIHRVKIGAVTFGSDRVIQHGGAAPEGGLYRTTSAIICVQRIAEQLDDVFLVAIGHSINAKK
jgi:hypothetical protein